MNIALLWHNKKADIVQLDDIGASENINQNLDALFQDIARMAQQINAYKVNLASANDVTGVLPLANVTGGPVGQALTGNGNGVAPTYQAASGGSSGMPLPYNRRVAWSQGDDSFVIKSVGINPALAGYTNKLINTSSDFNEFDTTAAIGNVCGIGSNVPFCLIDQLPVMAINLRTGNDITAVRYWIGFTQPTFTNTDNQGTNKSVAIRYSTVAGDAGWIGSTTSGTAQTLTTSLGAVAANTNYLLLITVVSPTQIDFSVNGGAKQTITTNIPLATSMLVNAHLITTTAAIRVFYFSRFYFEAN